MSKTSIWPWVMIAGLALVGCRGKADDPMQTATVSSDDGNDGNSSTSGSPAMTTIGPSDTTSTTSTTTATTGGSESSGGGQDSGSTGMVFLIEPDFDGCGRIHCDLLEQDCPKGEKCMPYDDCWGTWDSTRCSPIDDDPGQPGDECTVVGSATSGIDSCDLGAMCWYVDPQTNMGTCVAMCTGDEYVSFCEDPDTTCAIDDGSYLVLCLPSCDPILQDCPEGEACYYWPWDTWNCAPDASGDEGVSGDPCDFFNWCDPGYICVNDSCTAVCDLTDPMGDAQCEGAAEGQTCVPWYEEGAVPPGYENVGFCMLPA